MLAETDVSKGTPLGADPGRPGINPRAQIVVYRVVEILLVALGFVLIAGGALAAALGFALLSLSSVPQDGSRLLLLLGAVVVAAAACFFLGLYVIPRRIGRLKLGQRRSD